MAFRAAIKILEQHEVGQAQRYVRASTEEKAAIREEWGIHANPTVIQLEKARDLCLFNYRNKSITYSSTAGLVSMVAAGMAAHYFLPGYLKESEPLLTGAGVIGGLGVGGITALACEFLHTRKHPGGKDCQDERNKRGLEYIARIEGGK